MAYEINKTDGSLLTSVPDGEVDSSSTSIRLLGKNYPGYGEIMAENLVGMLENFSATTAPPSPVHGQIWYDKQNSRLAFFDKDNSWKSIFSEGQSDFSTVLVSDTAPVGELKTGDVWYDKGDQGRAFIWIGSAWVDLSPAGNATGGSGVSAYTLPPATASSLGGIKVGSGLSVDSSGLLTATGSGGTSYTLPTASTTTLGGVKVDGTTITITNGVISAAGSGSVAGPTGPQGPAGPTGPQGPAGAGGVGSAGQTWQQVNKAIYRRYTNTTGKPIMIALAGYATYPWDISINVDGLGMYSTSHIGGYPNNLTCIIPPGSTYYATTGQSAAVLRGWYELRDGVDDSASYTDMTPPPPPPPPPPGPPVPFDSPT